MKKLIPMLAAAVVFSGLSLLVQGAEDEKVTITGHAVCAKCALKEADSCQNVVISEKNGETTKYYLVMNDVSKKVHRALGICTAPKDGGPTVKVEGTVEEKDGKKVLTPTSIEKAGE